MTLRKSLIFSKHVGTASAQRITDKILGGVENLVEFPHMDPPHPDSDLTVLGYRKLVLTKIYVAVYRVIGDVVPRRQQGYRLPQAVEIG